MADESALFIDFENIRYSMLNIQHREPDPQELINVARRYGTVMVAKAYADWSRQPEIFKGSLMAAMIDRVDCPAKQRDRYRPAWQAQGGFNALTNGREASIEAVADESDEDDEEIDEEEDEEIEQVVSPPIALPSSPPPYSSGYATQSTVDLNMLMDIIETVFDRPSIQTFVLMTGDRDFTRICARLKLRLNKFVVVAGVPGTVSRDLTAAANQFVLLGNSHGGAYPAQTFSQPMPGLEPTDPQFLQFLDYIDRHWAWRTVIGVSNFIGDPYNHKNRFRGRLTRESARELLMTCIQQGILLAQTDAAGNEDLRLNRANPLVEAALANQATQMPQQPPQPGAGFGGPGPYSQMGPWTQGFGRRTISPSMDAEEDLDDEDEDEDITVEIDHVSEDVESD
jgi:uncharacterized LabA/DUF88 family protein